MSGDAGQARKRRCLMVERGLAEELRRVAEARGMTLSGYTRSLVEAALEAERAGVYAPAALRRGLAVERLRRLGATLAPLELVDAAGAEAARRAGERLALLLRSLGLGLREALEAILPAGAGLLESGEGLLVSLPPSPGLEALVEGLLRGYGAAVKRVPGGLVASAAEDG